MNLESSRTNEKSEDEEMKEVADEALVGIENAWENHTENPDGFPLSSDFAYLEIQKQLEAHARAYGEALFRMARSTMGKERMRYADGLSHFFDIIKKDTAEKVLESMLTNRETVQELRRKAREENENDHPSGKTNNFISRWWKNA